MLAETKGSLPQLVQLGKKYGAIATAISKITIKEVLASKKMGQGMGFDKGIRYLNV